MKNDQAREPIVAVCDNVAYVYGPVEPNGRRPLLRTKAFAHHGAAVQYAVEFEEPQQPRASA